MANMVTEVYAEDIEDGRTVEVHMAEGGEYWVGVTTIRSPKDWTFVPREQYATKDLAIDAAVSLAKGIRFDAAH